MSDILTAFAWIGGGIFAFYFIVAIILYIRYKMFYF